MFYLTFVFNGSDFAVQHCVELDSYEDAEELCNFLKEIKSNSDVVITTIKPDWA